MIGLIVDGANISYMDKAKGLLTLTNDEALKEIYEAFMLADKLKATAKNDMQAAMLYALALGRIAITLKRMGYDVGE